MNLRLLNLKILEGAIFNPVADQLRSISISISSLYLVPNSWCHSTYRGTFEKQTSSNNKKVCSTFFCGNVMCMNTTYFNEWGNEIRVFEIIMD